MNLLHAFRAVVALVALLIVACLLWTGPPGTEPTGLVQIAQAMVTDTGPPGFVVPAAAIMPQDTAQPIKDTYVTLDKSQSAVCAGEEGRAAQSAWYEPSGCLLL